MHIHVQDCIYIHFIKEKKSWIVCVNTCRSKAFVCERDG